MREYGRLVFNEVEKVYRKKRLLVITLLLLVLIPIFIYAQFVEVQTKVKRLGTDDWRIALQQQIVEQQNRMNGTAIPDDWKNYLSIQVKQEQYYLEHDINPNAPGAPTFVREFISQGIGMFLPLLVMIIAIDLVSGERSDGTIKLLLTRPVKRWKILASKYMTLLLFVSLILLTVITIAYVFSGAIFGYRGWMLPVVTGFSIKGSDLITNSVQLIPQWQYILMSAGLAWFVCAVVGTISFMVSVLIRNTPAGMGVMFAALITGNILKGFATNWEGAKYIFSVNLELTDFLSGNLPLLEGLTMSFSLLNLAAWGIGALFISFIVFTRQDILG